jgi:hypothetical protein
MLHMTFCGNYLFDLLFLCIVRTVPGMPNHALMHVLLEIHSIHHMIHRSWKICSGFKMKKLIQTILLSDTYTDVRNARWVHPWPMFSITSAGCSLSIRQKAYKLKKIDRLAACPDKTSCSVSTQFSSVQFSSV